MLTFAITTLLIRESCLKFAKDVAEVLGVRDLRSIACEVWSRRFQLKPGFSLSIDKKISEVGDKREYRIYRNSIGDRKKNSNKI